MKFALVNEQKTEAQPKLKGLCPGCLQPVTAKCGTQKIWHWAHLTKKTCDSWRERETEWHRNWKNKFPQEWQEYLQYDQSGEKHIADVRTPHGLVIEFQHSHLDPQERATREKFYGNMVWVVDGTRLKRDWPRFQKGMINFHKIADGYFLARHPEECFPQKWLQSSVPVIFDFQGIISTDLPDEPSRGILACLIPGQAERHAVVYAMDRERFIKMSSEISVLFDTPQIIRGVSAYIQQQRTQNSRRNTPSPTHYRTSPQRGYKRRRQRRM